MKNFCIIVILLTTIVNFSSAQKDVRSFIFGHSLIHHENQVNITPSQETSVPHWLHFLSLESGHEFAVSGQYGFLPQHANLPPVAQWGFDFVSGAWDSDYESFSDADFTNILITPGNFIQWQGPDEDYIGEDISPVEATNSIVEWCDEQEAQLNFYIYENWPDMAPFLNNGFPPSESEWNTYLEYLNGDFHDWFLRFYYEVLSSNPNSCVRMIPVGTLINNLLKIAPFDQIPISELYEDDAPHGQASIYFLASLATYMGMFEERPSPNYEVDDIIHPIIQANYNIAVDFIWDELLAFEVNGVSLVFCTEDINSVLDESNVYGISTDPNPSSGIIEVSNLQIGFSTELYSPNGNLLVTKSYNSATDNQFNLADWSNGIYFIIVRDSMFNIVYRKKIIKI